MSNVKSEFYNVKPVNTDFTRKYAGKWYYVKAKPVPKKVDLINVVSDLIQEKDVHISQECKIEHLYNCSNHFHNIDKKLRKILIGLSDDFYNQEFLLLIKTPVPDIVTGLPILYGQPQVYVLKPYINFDSYPNHPHINGYTQTILATTICYSGEYDFYNGKSDDEKITYAVQQSTIWLLKHLLWIELRKVNYPCPWIAPAGSEIDIVNKIGLANPNGLCVCGSNKIFKDCCLTELLKRKYGHPFFDKTKIENELQKKWDAHNSFECDFRNYFLEVINNIAI